MYSDVIKREVTIVKHLGKEGGGIIAHTLRSAKAKNSNVVSHTLRSAMAKEFKKIQGDGKTL